MAYPVGMVHPFIYASDGRFVRYDLNLTEEVLAELGSGTFYVLSQNRGRHEDISQEELMQDYCVIIEDGVPRKHIDFFVRYYERQ